MARTKKSGGKKRTLSSKQRAALKKGQLALARWRKAQRKNPGASKKKTSNPKSKKVSTSKRGGGGGMSTARRVVKKATRKVTSYARRSGAVEMLQDAGLVVVSGITAGWLVAKLPSTVDARVKSIIPIAGGIILANFAGRNRRLLKVSQGMVVLGSVSLFKQMLPNVPMLAGERVILLPRQNNTSYMGRRIKANRNGAPSYMGRRIILSGNRNQEYKTAAS